MSNFIKPIKTETEYEEALERVFELLQTQPNIGTPEGNEIEVLTTLIESYEAVHHPISPTDPITYLKNKIEQMGLKQQDLIPFIDDKTQVSKILNRKRELTLPMIKKLCKGLNLPVNRLIGS